MMTCAGLLLAPLLTLPEAAPLGVDSAIASAEACPPSPDPSGGMSAEARLEIYRTLHSAVEAFGLRGCWKAKPLLSGKEVCGLFLAWKLMLHFQTSMVFCSVTCCKHVPACACMTRMACSIAKRLGCVRC